MTSSPLNQLSAMPGTSRSVFIDKVCDFVSRGVGLRSQFDLVPNFLPASNLELDLRMGSDAGLLQRCHRLRP